jgi:hypothetical protein
MMRLASEQARAMPGGLRTDFEVQGVLHADLRRLHGRRG